MAKVLMEIPFNEFTPEDVRANPAEVCRRLHSAAVEAIERELTVPDSRLADDFQYEECDELILGALDAERLKAEVSGWNEAIRQELIRTMQGLFQNPDSGLPIPPDQVELDSQSTYALKKAVIAADNCFYDYAERIVALPSEFCLRSLVSDNELEDLLAEPEWYAVIPVYVK